MIQITPKSQVIEPVFQQTRPNKCSFPEHLTAFAALSKQTTHLPINHSYDFVILDDDIRGLCENTKFVSLLEMNPGGM